MLFSIIRYGKGGPREVYWGRRDGIPEEIAECPATIASPGITKDKVMYISITIL